MKFISLKIFEIYKIEEATIEWETHTFYICGWYEM